MSPTFRSLRVRNYRLYATGQLLANTGVWMQRVAQDWLVLELTDGSATALGITVGLQFLPMLLFSLWGGGLADRFRRRQLLVVTTALLGVAAFSLGVLVLTGVASVSIVMAMAFLVGSIAAFDGPARQAFVSEMVDVEDLPNAVALNTASFNLGRVFGPAVAGLLIAAVGSGWVFILNTIGYLAVLVALSRIRPDDLAEPVRPAGDSGGLAEGIRYVRARPDLVLVLIIAFFVGTFGLNFQLTIAAMVTGEFGLGPAAFGVASTVLAVGSLSGSLAAARRGAPRIRLVVLAALAFGVAAVVVALMPTYLMFLVALPLVGMGALTLINATQSFLQLNSEPELRGRVMGIYTLLFLGGTPIGSPLVGWVAETAGPRWSIALGGIVSALAALTVAVLHVRRAGLEVRAHAHPRPHLHIAEPDDLDAVRPGWRLTPSAAPVAASSRAIALPAIAVLVALSAFGAAPRSTEPTPGEAERLTSTRLADVQDPRIDEASGMSVSRLHPGVVWLVNDSKGGEIVYGVDESGETVAELTLRNIYNRDWEAMAPGVDDSEDPALWIADIGDNDAQWPSVRVYRIPEPAKLGKQDIPWRRVELRYPDGAHNAETLMVDESGRIVIVTKEALGAGVYATPKAPGLGTTVELERVGPAPMLLTDGAISPDGTQVALRSYTSFYLYDAKAFLSRGTDGDAGTVYPLPLQPQGETLAYELDGAGVLVGSEGVEQPIYAIGLPDAADGRTAPTKSASEDSSGALWALGLAVILLVSGAAALVMRKRGRVLQPSSPIT
ncbi:MAG: MFS transporter [Actinomycetia bacterium]|nr:MFS transporter [Actinomycetes bacterium]